MKLLKANLALLVIPLALLVLSIWMMGVRGPYDLGANLDPEYVALFNSLNLATFEPSYYFQHPATTTQILATGVVWVKWLVGGVAGGWDSLPVAVISDHAGYLRGINLAHMLLLGLVSFLAGWQVRRCSGSLGAALVVQFTPLLFLTPVEALPRVAPELMEVIVGMALVIPLAPLLFGTEPEVASRNPRLAIAAGALLACGIATKANFFTLGLLVFLFPGWKQKLRFVGGSAVSLAFLLLPLALTWRELVGWFYNMATRSGHYGTGAAGLPEASVYWQNLGQVFENERFLFYLLGIYVLVLGALLLAPKDGRGPRWSLYRKALLVGVLTIGLHAMVTGKHYFYHYILPATLVAILMNGLLVVIFRDVRFSRYVRIALIALAVWVGYEGARHNYTRMLWYKDWRAEYHEHIARVAKAREAMPECQTIGYYRSSAPGYALAFGMDLSRYRQQEAMSELYPNAILTAATESGFVRWDYQDAGEDVRRTVSSGGCILIQGEVANPRVPKGYRLEPVFEPENRIHGAEGLFRLRREADTTAEESPK